MPQNEDPLKNAPPQDAEPDANATALGMPAFQDPDDAPAAPMETETAPAAPLPPELLPPRAPPRPAAPMEPETAPIALPAALVNESPETVLNAPIPPEVLAAMAAEQAAPAPQPVPVGRKVTGMRAAVQLPPEPSAAPEEQATVLGLKAPVEVEPAPRVKSGERAAVLVAPDAQEGQATVLGLKAPVEAEPAPAPRARSGVRRAVGAEELEGDDENTAPRGMKAGVKPGSKPEAAKPEAKPNKRRAKAPEIGGETVSTVETRVRRGANGIQVMAGLIILLVVGAVVLKVALGPSKPSSMQLHLLYPYQEGATLPNGRDAPPVGEVQFAFENEAECSGLPCIKYLVSKPGTAFLLEMTLQRVDGNWTVIGAAPPPIK